MSSKLNFFSFLILCLGSFFVWLRPSNKVFSPLFFLFWKSIPRERGARASIPSRNLKTKRISGFVIRWQCFFAILHFLKLAFRSWPYFIFFFVLRNLQSVKKIGIGQVIIRICKFWREFRNQLFKKGKNILKMIFVYISPFWMLSRWRKLFYFSLLFLRNSLLGRVFVLGDPHVSIRHLHCYLLNKDRSLCWHFL